jgi:WD40 repeat protein
MFIIIIIIIIIWAHRHILLLFFNVKSNDPFSDLNLIDWSPNNILAVSLGSNVYLWNASTGSIQQLLTLEGSDSVCSVGWIQEGHYLAVGTSMGLVQVCYSTNLQTAQHPAIRML